MTRFPMNIKIDFFLLLFVPFKVHASTEKSSEILKIMGTFSVTKPTFSTVRVESFHSLHF